MTLDYEELEKRIYRKMNAEGLNQKQVAKQLGLNSRRIFETLDCGMDFKMSTLLRIMDWLGIENIKEISN